MKKFLFLLGAIAFIASGCGQKPAANTASTATPKPSASAATKAAPKKAPAANPVPADWIRMYDDVKGYEFMVPKGTEHKSETVDGVDVYMASVPAPYEIGVMVVAFKDKTIGKDELLKRAENILKAMEEKDIKIDEPKELNDDYSVRRSPRLAKMVKRARARSWSLPTSPTITSCWWAAMPTSLDPTKRPSTRFGVASRCTAAAPAATTKREASALR